MNARPLADLRVLAIEQYAAGPWGSMQLADLGADVIKVEDPRAGGDIGRYIPPFQEGVDSLFFEALNRGKRSITLDLRSARARPVLEDLVRQVDAVYFNLRGDQPARLGLTYERLGKVNPRIVCCSLSGYGTSGPRAHVGAYDYVIQGLAGWMSVTGDPGGKPTKTGPSLVDYCGGYVAGIALLAGVWKARRDGIGCDCDVSLLETALALLGYLGTWAATHGYEQTPVADSGHPSIVPFQNFRTADGWIVVACPKEKFWLALCHALNREDLATDERFRGFAGRSEHRETVLTELRAAFAGHDTAHWLDVLNAAGVPCGPVNGICGALEDPQFVARDGIVATEHPRLGEVRHVRTPLRVDGPGPAPTRGPRPGEHTAEVLMDVCGYDRQRIEVLKDEGVFG